MLEIFGIMMLCKANRKNALARGKRPGGFVALTIILWVGLELIGFIIGAALELDYGIILLAYGLAGLGALGSWLIAKFGPRGNYAAPSTVNATGAPIDDNMPVIGTYDVPVEQIKYAPKNTVPVNNVPVNATPAVAIPVNGVPQNTQTPNFCSECGKPLNPGSHFCGQCGAKIEL